ncbi:DNA polymerase III subunit delta' [Roseivivax sp. CAU 1761]
MSEPAALPEPDRLEGAPHPRDTAALLGQEAAERAFLDAFAAGRLHHGWLITGPRGVGKATLAWRIARFLLAHPDPEAADGLFGAPPVPDRLEIAPDHPVARRVAALSEPGLTLLRRGPTEKGDRLATEILVREVRNLKRRLALSAADGGRRVVIVDAADEMNVQAANALLKLLEEPPARCVLLLVCHQPARLLPTIRSRCRELRLRPLAASDMAAALAQAGAEIPEAEAAALAELSAGSVGAAWRLLALDGLALYDEILEFFAALPDLDRTRALALADRVALRGREAERDLLVELVDLALTRLARTGALGQPPERPARPGEPAILARLAPGPAAGRAWAETAQAAGEKVRRGLAVNVDAAALLFDMLQTLRDTAARVRAA